MTESPTARPELLAPAGEVRALRAALAAGADAVYFGLEHFSARAFAGNFPGEAAVEAVELAHRWDARAYLALNTLLKDDEMESALSALQAPYLAGLDALIVADLGFAALVRDQYPGLALHASTQLNTHSSAQLEALARLGFRRAVLARELSLTEIAALDARGLELEVFVHGALCYGYSGDCLFSSMIGGRSGNRGRCSQACRMRYALRLAEAPPVAAGALEPGTPAPTRALSTSDLAAIGILPQLIAAGVSSLKIEGRMKDPAYVGVTTAVYREALDEAWADPQGFAVRPEWLARLEQSFSRSFTTAHLTGRHSEVRSGGRSGHRGVLVGRVAAVDDERGSVRVRLARPLAAGDVVYLYTPWGQSEPVRVQAAADTQVTLKVRERVAVKDRLFRLAAAEVDGLARDLVAGRVAVRPTQLSMLVEGTLGEPVRLTAWPLPAAGDAPAGSATEAVTVRSAVTLAPARTVALNAARVRDALGALGGTPYALDNVRFELPAGAYLAVSELKELRRRAVAALQERRLAARRRSSGRVMARPPGASGVRGAPGGRRGGVPAWAQLTPGREPAVILVVRAREESAPAPGVAGLCLDVRTSDPTDSVAAARSRLHAYGLPVRVRLPEVLFDADTPWLRQVLALGWDAAYAGHLGVLGVADEVGVSAILEYPLQGLNALAAEAAGRLAPGVVSAVVASPEASLPDIAGLAASLAVADPPAAVEALAFGRVQVLHTRDQLGRAEGLYDPPGPAGHVGLELQDAKGYVFPATVEATGTRVANARVTNLAGNLDELADAGVAAALVVQADMDGDEARAFRAGGLPALAAFAGRERSTTGHLFRGVT